MNISTDHSMLGDGTEVDSDTDRDRGKGDGKAVLDKLLVRVSDSRCLSSAPEPAIDAAPEPSQDDSESSDDDEECLVTSIQLSMPNHMQTAQQGQGYLPTAFHAHDTSSDSDEDENFDDDASACSSSVQLNIVNPSNVDVYVSAAVNMDEQCATAKNFLGADISLNPSATLAGFDDDEGLSDDDDFEDNKEPMQTPSTLSAVFSHLGIRRRKTLAT
jgi:hypothetical protein